MNHIHMVDAGRKPLVAKRLAIIIMQRKAIPKDMNTNCFFLFEYRPHVDELIATLNERSNNVGSVMVIACPNKTSSTLARAVVIITKINHDGIEIITNTIDTTIFVAISIPREATL